MTRRKAIPLKTKLAVALRMLGLKADGIQWDHDPALELRPYDEAAGDTIPPANDPAYIQILTIEEHKEKTARDAKLIAKVHRLEGRTGQAARREKRGGGSIRSRGFQTNRDGAFKQRMDGSIERRT